MAPRLYNILMGICVALVVAGAGVLVGTWAAPQWDAYRAEMQVSSMQAAATSSSTTAEGQAQLSEARSYNAALAGSSSSASATPYPLQLTAVDATAISWLHIPSINVRRPVYHYDNEEVLMAGVGHIEGTSLPVGGESTHCCVTGHSGMLGSRMFDDLHRMRKGDVFVFWTLGDPYAYRVYDIEVVGPDDTSSLYIVPGRDLATLITCTPYGINSHRLLVHGERCEYVPEEVDRAEAHPTSDRLWVLALGVAAAAALVGLALYALLWRRSLKLVAISERGVGEVWRRGAEGAEGAGGGTRVEIRPFGRAEVDIGGRALAARWRHAGRGYLVDLSAGAAGAPVPIGAGASADVELPAHISIERADGAWVAHATVDGLEGTLTFER